MVLTAALAILTAVSFVLTFWRWRVACAFPSTAAATLRPRFPG